MLKNLNSIPAGLDARKWSQSSQVLGIAFLNLGFALYLSTGHLYLPAGRPSWAVVFWLVAIGLFLVGCRYIDDELGIVKPVVFGWSYREWLICTAIFIVALALRLYKVGSAPLTLHNDEAVMGLHTITLMAQPTARIYTFDEFSTTKLWYYFLALGVLLKGQTQSALRVMPAFLGAWTVFPAYYFARLLFDRRIAIITISLLASYHFHIHFSRVAVNNITDPLWGVLIYSTLYMAFITRRRFLFGVTGLLIGFSLHFYTGARLFLPLTGLVWLLWAIRQRQATDHPAGGFGLLFVHSALFLLLGVVFAAALIAYNTIQDPYWFLTRLQLEGISEGWIADVTAKESWGYTQFWWEQIKRSALAFHINGEAGYGNYYDLQYPLLSTGAMLLFSWGLLIGLIRIREWRFQLLWAWFMLTIVFGGVLLRNPPAVQRYVTLSVVVSLFMAVALQSAWQFCCRRWPKAGWVWQGLLLAVVLYLSATSISRYFTHYLPRETYGTNKSQTATLIGYYLAAQPPNTQVFYIGDKLLSYYKSGVPHYLAPQLSAEQRQHLNIDAETKRLFSRVELHDGVARPTVFLVAPYDWHTIAFLRYHYPTARRKSLIWPLTDQRRMETFFIASDAQH